MFVIANFLLYTVSNHDKYLFVNLHPSSCICAILCFISPTYLLCDSKYNFPKNATSKTSFLSVIPTYIYLITKINIFLTKRGALSAQVTEALMMELN